MSPKQERLERFTAEISEMNLPNTSSSRDRTLLRLGAALMALGVLISIVAYPISHGTTNALQQRDAIVIAITGLVVAMVGCAMFLRYSIAQFLRFWMARITFEQGAATDRLAEIMGDRD